MAGASENPRNDRPVICFAFRRQTQHHDEDVVAAAPEEAFPPTTSDTTATKVVHVSSSRESVVFSIEQLHQQQRSLSRCSMYINVFRMEERFGQTSRLMVRSHHHHYNYDCKPLFVHAGCERNHKTGRGSVSFAQRRGTSTS